MLILMKTVLIGDLLACWLKFSIFMVFMCVLQGPNLRVLTTKIGCNVCTLLACTYRRNSNIETTSVKIAIEIMLFVL